MTFEAAAQAGLFGTTYPPDLLTFDIKKRWEMCKQDVAAGRLDAAGAVEVMESIFEELTGAQAEVDRHVTITVIGHLPDLKGKVIVDVGHDIRPSEESDRLRLIFKDKSELDIYFEQNAESKSVVVSLP